MEHGGDCDNNCKSHTQNDPQMIKKAGRVGNQKTRRDPPDHRIVKIGKNSEKNPRDSRRLAFTQYSLKDQQTQKGLLVG